MDCGVPFCHWACPLGNKPPEWNDALYRGDWELAYRLLNSTNDFPEFTGRVCPALCEKACVLNLVEHEPTTNREDEAAITEHAFEENYVSIHHPERNGKKVAVIGSGPAGLVAANRLNLAGYLVTVFDKNEDAGGLLRYGIPNFKLNKAVIDRRMGILRADGIEFKFNQEIDVEHLPGGFDAYVIATGTPTARDLPIPGRDLKGVHFALDMLAQQNRVLAGAEIKPDELVSAKGRRRRHRQRLHRHGPPPGMQERDADRDYAQAARRPRRSAKPVAGMAAHAQDHIEPRGRMRAPMERQLAALHR